MFYVDIGSFCFLGYFINDIVLIMLLGHGFFCYFYDLLLFFFFFSLHNGK